MDLATLLTEASSSDPQILRSASSKLEEISIYDPLFLSHLTECIFSDSVALPPSAQLVGLVHLKNLVSKAPRWQQFAPCQQDFLRDSLLHHIRLNPSPNPFVSEITGWIFRHDWSQNTWPKRFWDSLIHSGAWTPLRRCVQRAAAFRLSVRRRVLASHISSLLPNIVGLWIETNSVELLHTIYTCITVLDAETAASMMTTHADVVGGLVSQALMRLLTAEGEGLKRLAKLLHAVFFLISPELRSSYAVTIVDGTVTAVESNSLDRPTIVWCLALVFNIISAAFCEDPSKYKFLKFPTITAEARSNVLVWLLSPNNKAPHHSNAGYFVLNLMRSWMPLQAPEIEIISSDPESCYSSGGAHCFDYDGTDLSFFAEDFWIPESASDMAVCFPVTADQSPNLRKLAESLFRLLTRHLDGHLDHILPSALEELMGGDSDVKEVALRCAQFLLEVQPMQWCGRVDTLLAMTTPFTDPLLVGRRMSLMVRRALVGSCSPAVLHQNCVMALSQLAECLRIQCDSKSPRIAIHLAAAYCFFWLVDNPLFPPDVPSKAPSTLLQQILDCLADLAREVEEFETRLVLLRYMQGVFENVDIGAHFECFLNVVQQMWQMGESATAVRAGAVDLVTTVVRALNADTTSAEVALLAERLTNLIVPSVLLPHLSLFVRCRDESNKDGSNSGDIEVLGEACLRLWDALVTGNGATWLPCLESLMPLLTETPSGDGDGGGEQTLYARLETSYQAQLFFDIANGCLHLGASPHFLSAWTEPFWRPLLRQVVIPDDVYFKFPAPKFLDSTLADQPESEKSDFMLAQLKLLTAWCSQIIRFRTPLSPSFCGLLLLHTKVCLIQTHVEIHDDDDFKYTHLRLLLLAQLAASPDYWNFLFAVFTTAAAQKSTRDFSQHCLQLSSANTVPPAVDNVDCQGCLESFLTLLLARSDALANRFHRRCFSLAAIFCLRHLLPSNPLSGAHLESAISLCVQVLCEVDESPNQHPDEVAWVPPATVASPQQLKSSLRLFLGDASGLTTADVDPALLSQLTQRLA